MRQVFNYKIRQFYYKMRQLLQIATILLQNATVITKCDVYYKLRQYSVFKQLMSEFSDVMSTSSSGTFNTSLIGLVILNVSPIIPLFLNSAISFSNDL